MRTWISQARKGLVELCVLGALHRGEAYGYEILQRLAQANNFAITESTVYPVLARLAKEGTLEVRVAHSPSGPPRRYYRLTEDGRRRLDEMRRYWRELTVAVDGLLFGEQS